MPCTNMVFGNHVFGKTGMLILFSRCNPWRGKKFSFFRVTAGTSGFSTHRCTQNNFSPSSPACLENEEQLTAPWTSGAFSWHLMEQPLMCSAALTASRTNAEQQRGGKRRCKRRALQFSVWKCVSGVSDCKTNTTAEINRSVLLENLPIRCTTTWEQWALSSIR